MGIEPTPEAWEASILPLNYGCSVAAGIIRSANGQGADELPLQQ